MIDPIQSLSFSVQANPGVYALLLGSGVSRAAKVPTGWEITLDLVRKLAVLDGEEIDITPERWYLKKFGMEPSYSDLLNQLAKTPAARQQLLRPYFESTDQDREDGDKQPTQAHRAIAKLAAEDYVRVILTTNFDSLVENALTEQGITPTVLSSPDDVQGALPLIHTRCCVVKLHGDYRDTRIRNTPSELDEYPQEFDVLLDRILDEFGLIVCGWSAEWDTALCAAFRRAPSRRFTTYWAARGEIGTAARHVIDQRGAEVVHVKDADTFFNEIRENVESIQAFSKPHPLSTEAAVASLKRYVSESRHRIRLSDLLDDTVDKLMEVISGQGFSLGEPPPTAEAMTARVRRYEAACSTLLAMAPIGGYWVEEDHFRIWERALVRLGSTTASVGTPFVTWSDLRRYPATLLLYAAGIGAVESGRLPFFGRLLDCKLHREHREDVFAADALPPFAYESSVADLRRLTGTEGYAPLNDWIHDALRQHAKRILPNNAQYTLAFDRLELLIALNSAHRHDMWLPGAFNYRSENRKRVLHEIEQSLATDGDQSSYVRSRIFGGAAQNCQQSLKVFRELLQRHPWL